MTEVSFPDTRTKSATEGLQIKTGSSMFSPFSRDQFLSWKPGGENFYSSPLALWVRLGDEPLYLADKLLVRMTPSLVSIFSFGSEELPTAIRYAAPYRKGEVFGSSVEIRSLRALFPRSKVASYQENILRLKTSKVISNDSPRLIEFSRLTSTGQGLILEDVNAKFSFAGGSAQKLMRALRGYESAGIIDAYGFIATTEDRLDSIKILQRLSSKKVALAYTYDSLDYRDSAYRGHIWQQLSNQLSEKGIEEITLGPAVTRLRLSAAFQGFDLIRQTMTKLLL